jgi:hypothetical protein
VGDEFAKPVTKSLDAWLCYGYNQYCKLSNQLPPERKQMTQFTEAQQDKLYTFFAQYVYCELRGTSDPAYYSDHWTTDSGASATKTSMLKNMRRMGLPLIDKMVKLGYLTVETVGKWSVYAETDKFAELLAEFDSQEAANDWINNRTEIAGWEQLVADGTVIYEKHQPLVIC